MPIMDGFETTLKMVDICSMKDIEQPYIVALTADNVKNKQIREKCKNCGMSDCFPKPFSDKQIEKLLIKLEIINDNSQAPYTT